MQGKEFEVVCPHCKEFVIIEQVNCAIFRHGIYKENFIQINPHLSKNECDKLVSNNLIYGCGKPFKIKKNHENIWVADECDYI